MNSIRVYAQWWRTWKTLPVFPWIKAARLYRAGAYQQAESLYRAGLEKRPTHPARVSAQLDLAYCLFKQKKVVEAEQELRVVVETYPENREGYIRLARIQFWTGRSADASLTLRRGLQSFDADAEMAALLLFSLVDYGASAYLIGEATAQARRAIEQNPGHKLLRTAQARCMYHTGDKARAKDILGALALEDPALFEAVVAYAEVMIEEKKVEEGLLHLRRALQVSPNHPRVLSKIARAYLLESRSYNPDYGQQLAISACQASNWSSPRDMHVLAEAYSQSGDKMAALVTAHRAVELDSQSHRDHVYTATISRLIESLRSDIQA